MRVSQIQNLTWAGNLLVLGGLVWVGLQFWEAKKLSQKPSKEPVWEKTKGDDPNKNRWPPELTAFSHIWATPINGKVPPPPAPPKVEEKKLDRIAEFKQGFKFLVGGVIFPKEPERSLARANYGGKEFFIHAGEVVPGTQFQLVRYSFDEVKRLGFLSFRDPDTGNVFTIEQAPSQAPPLANPANEVFRKGYGNLVQEGKVTENGPLPSTAFQDPESGDWIIPEEEQAWIENFGQKNLLDKLAVKPDVDAQGVAHGLRINSIPEHGTHLAPTHGIGTGDIVRSINGHPVTSKEDIANYLRNEGKGLKRYAVVVDTGGVERTIVYRVPDKTRP